MNPRSSRATAPASQSVRGAAPMKTKQASTSSTVSAPSPSRIRTGDDEAEEPVDACFVFIGAAPRTDWLDGVVARDERGFILAGADAKVAGWPLSRDPSLLETTVPGVFVAGDVRARSIKRVASAVGEGSMAVSLVHQYLVDG